ncbi:UNVERIFIED_CONTAM: hypothetical protein Scaly_1070800 [Sesamum calycinum]|uniref:Integrase catalytic domain-containing protein n=1 Tax=Sesamum calycinum TaxID=2727403 RepID=A0AAW2QKY4_9LAMI
MHIRMRREIPRIHDLTKRNRSQSRKDQAILEMKPPRTIQEVQRLTGRLAALNRFILLSSDRDSHFSSGAGVILETPLGDKIQYALRFSFDASNNKAEYEALLVGGRLAQAAGAKYLRAYSDSQLVVNQVNGDYEAKGIEDPANEVLVNTNKTCWKDTIEAYLTTGSLPTDRKETKTIRTRATHFTMIGGELYKRGFSQPYLKCPDPERAEYVLREVHEASCRNHSGGRSLADKILRQGYFWPSIQKDAMDMVRRCQKCQEHANITYTPATLMQPIPNPCPFDQWGMDLVGKLPRATGQREYLIVAVDYFSK